jgi:hypothetical protein
MPQFPAVIDPSTLDGTTGFRLNGAAAYNQAGWSVASAGDVNGDGFDDLIVGAPTAPIVNSNAVASGITYVVFGAASGFAPVIDLSGLDGTSGFRLSGVAAHDHSGISVASAGDVNGDGFDDVIIGGDAADINGDYSGTSYVVFGTGAGFASNVDLSGLDGTTGFRLTGAAEKDAAGHSVASAGDVNGDGFDDVIIGAAGANPNGRTPGASYVVFGTDTGFASNIDLSSLDGSNGFKISGVVLDDRTGTSVASGDINGDGYDDLIMGARFADPNGYYSGATYVVFGTDAGFASNVDLSGLDGSNGFKLSGVAAYDQSGRSVASAGDINGDGFDDVIVGAPFADPNGTRSGASYVVFGKEGGFAANIELSSLDGSNGFRISGATERDFSGSSVASAGDVNGDGFDDVIVGAPYTGLDDYDHRYFYSGASYVVFGKAGGFASDIDVASLDGTNGFKIEALIEGVYDYNGQSVASAGDVNGDGFDDLIIGSRFAGANGYHSGSSYVVFGRAPAEAVVRTGTDASQTLAGGDFDDTLIGLGGDDELFGNGGDDSLSGGDGTDVLRGGDGDDTYYADSIDDAVVEVPGQGTDTVHTTASFALGHNVENLIVDTDQDLLLRGNGRDNIVTGGGGDDRLVGQYGNDTLTGGAGRDVMLGGAGDDSFVFQALSDSVVGTGRDLIKDFEAGVDTIDLAAIDANSALADDQAFSFIGSGGFTQTAGELRAALFGANTLVSGDVDGNGQADFHILLTGHVALQATDFVL